MFDIVNRNLKYLVISLSTQHVHFFCPFIDTISSIICPLELKLEIENEIGIKKFADKIEQLTV